MPEQITTATGGEENVLLIAPAETVFEEGTLVETAPAEAAPTALDNALTIGITATVALAVIVEIIRKALSNKRAAAAPAELPTETAPEAPKPTAPGAAGEVKLNNVEPRTAAMLMAIVADKMQTPINELRFISIKEVE